MWGSHYVFSSSTGLDAWDLLGGEGCVPERQALVCPEHVCVPHTRTLLFTNNSNECIE